MQNAPIGAVSNISDLNFSKAKIITCICLFIGGSLIDIITVKTSPDKGCNAAGSFIMNKTKCMYLFFTPKQNN